MTGTELRDQIRALSHDDLVAVLMTLCSGMYPCIARDSVISEIDRRVTGRAGIVRAGECGTTEPAAPREAAGGLSQVSGGGSGI